MCSSVGVLLAGCSGDDPDAGLHAVSATVIHRPGAPNATYPTDVAIRVTVENTSSRTLTGTLVVDLVRDGPDGTESWTRDLEIEVSSATTRAFYVTVADVFETDGSSTQLDASARIERSTDDQQ